MNPLIIIAVYLALLLALGLLSHRFFRGTSRDYFVASHSIGPFLLLMSVFGTTMTAFALVGSTGEAYHAGIGVYGMMASWSGLVHAAVFFLVGIRLWAIGKRHGFVTQVQYFRDRFESPALGYLLFPVLVALVIPYLLIGLLASGSVIHAISGGQVAPWLATAVICAVVLTYVFFGGLRGAVWANTFQTLVFMVMGVVAFVLIASKLGGMAAASEQVRKLHPEKLVRGPAISQLHFFSYLFIPLSVGMFPHLFQHWLTARSAKTFRLTVILHPICIMLVWVPCILIGVWATSALMPDGSLVVPPAHPPNTELAIMVKKLTNPTLAGFLSAGILAAIMSSLDSQFLCLGTMFTHDIVLHHFGEERFSDRQKIWLARAFIVGIVLAAFGLSLFKPRQVFHVGIWCFSGFASLFPLVVASLYWKRVTLAGAMASLGTTAALWFALFMDSDFGANRKYLFHGMMPVTVIFAAALAALVLVSLVTKAPSPATIEKYFPETLRPARRSGAEGAPVTASAE